MAALEAELFNLCIHHQPKFIPTIKTRKQHAAEEKADETEKEKEDTPERRTPE
jgi:hypothetical protein